MKRWVPTPERAPWKCPFTHQDSAADGPYLEANLQYVALDHEGNPINRVEYQLYLSPQAIKEASLLPGSPIVVVDREKWEESGALYLRLEEENADQAAEIETLKDEIENLKARSPLQVVDTETLERWFEKADDRYARKRGKA